MGNLVGSGVTTGDLLGDLEGSSVEKIHLQSDVGDAEGGEDEGFEGEDDGADDDGELTQTALPPFPSNWHKPPLVGQVFLL